MSQSKPLNDSHRAVMGHEFAGFPNMTTQLEIDAAKSMGPPILVVTCPVDRLAEVLTGHLEDYDLLAQCAYQRGTGVGAKIEVLCSFRLKAGA
jgi:hypothetical protein